MAKKNLKSKFWLKRMHRIEMLHNFVPKPWEIYPFWYKMAFLANRWPIKPHVSQNS